MATNDSVTMSRAAVADQEPLDQARPRRRRLWAVVAAVTGLLLVLGAGSGLAVYHPAGHGRPAAPTSGATASLSPDTSVSASATASASASASATGCTTWSAGVSVATGDVITYQGKTYTAKFPHTLAKGVSWSPDTTPQLWSVGGTCTGPVPPRAPKFAVPAATWQEHWADHNQNVVLIAYNDTVALYFDRSVNTAAGKWILPFLTRVWQYAQRTYGNGGNRMGDGRLYSVTHEGRYIGGHASTVYDSDHDNRNVVDVGGWDWITPQYDVVAHETGHIVEGIAGGKHGSPAFDLWKDSKWMEFYLYDLYVALGMTTPAQDSFKNLMADTKTDDFPVADAHWFRDWFYPLWRDHGHAQVMVNYFRLLGQYFPANGADFARGLNWGEFIHFMSGAAGTDLKPLATKAFGWPADWETQYQEAKRTFPQIKY